MLHIEICQYVFCKKFVYLNNFREIKDKGYLGKNHHKFFMDWHRFIKETADFDKYLFL